MMNDKKSRLNKIRLRISMIQYYIAQGQISYDSILIHDGMTMSAGEVIDSLVKVRDLLEAELGVAE